MVHVFRLRETVCYFYKSLLQNKIEYSADKFSDYTLKYLKHDWEKV